MAPPTPPSLPLARSKAPPLGLSTRIRKALGAWLIDVEYRARVSRPFTYGRGGARVFYPGCSLTAADPALVMRAFEWLKARDPSVELWSDCCGMPLEKFSSPEAAERGRERTRRLLRESGTAEIITACGNCTVQFESLRIPGLKLTSLYGLLAEEDLGPRPESQAAVVHHPCSARIDKSQQTHFRALSKRLHLTIVNEDESKHPLSCCLIRTPAAMAKRRALAETKLITYCAHCTMAFQGDIPTRHVLQEIFGAPDDRWLPRGKVGRFFQYERFAQMASRSAQGVGAKTGPWVARAILGVLILGLVAMAATHLDLARGALALISWSRGAGLLGALVFALAYVLSTVLLLPGSMLTLGAGFAWGPVVGVAIVSPASVLAATAAFVLGRTLLRGRVERRVLGDQRFAAIDRAVGENGFRLVLLLRLSPVLPFNLLNYALALTRVSLRDYVMGSAIGMFPATVLYVYLGSVLTNGSELLAGKPLGASPAGTALYWMGLAATLAVVVFITRASRVALRKALVEQSP